MNYRSSASWVDSSKWGGGGDRDGVVSAGYIR